MWLKVLGYDHHGAPLFAQGAVRPAAGAGGGPYTPQQIRHAYGIDQVSATGEGQTIAIVDAYDDPSAEADLSVFKSTFGLGLNDCRFTKVNQNGGTSDPSSDSGWAIEISLDVQWACAIAPGANILLVEANSNGFSDLLSAVDYAAAHAQVVSMSWGANEFFGESIFDSHFSVTNVSFTAASGDNGHGVIYPAASPDVLAVGGTTLPLDSNGSLVGPETAWTDSGGGVSTRESEPGYQSNYPIPNTGGQRGVPDVSYDADPNTGFYVYDSTPYYGQTGWYIVGGTSAGAPQWAALIALANQGRSTPLSTNDSADSAVYDAAGAGSYGANFRDVTSGTNGSCGAVCTATSGYDFVTGLGSPLAPGLIAALDGGASAPVTDVAVTGCSPNNANPGDRLVVIVTGSNFESGATVDFGNRVMVQNVAFVGSGELDVQVKVHPKASPGSRAVTVTNPDGRSGSSSTCFRVN